MKTALKGLLQPSKDLFKASTTCLELAQVLLAAKRALSPFAAVGHPPVTARLKKQKRTKDSKYRKTEKRKKEDKRKTTANKNKRQQNKK